MNVRVSQRHGGEVRNAGTHPPFEDLHPRRARWIGPASAVVATGLGLAYLTAAGAPARYAGVNAGALVVGLIAMVAVGRWGRPSGIAILAMAAILLATALGGPPLDGVTRWIRVGPLALQPSLILLPAMCVMFTGVGGGVAACGLAIAALALALQPDRAMAGALAAGLTALALVKADRWSLAALTAAVAGIVVTIVRPDTLPAQPYVERVLLSAFQVHLLAGVAVWIGVGVLMLPAIMGAIRPELRQRHAVFGAVWLAVLGASALGNYPTPLVGYGASSILGYALSLGALTFRSAAPGRPRTARGVCV